MKSLTYHFHLKAEILADFQIYISVPLIGLFYSRKKPYRGVQEMEFPGVLKKENVEIPGAGQSKKKQNFQGVFK